MNNWKLLSAFVLISISGCTTSLGDTAATKAAAAPQNSCQREPIRYQNLKDKWFLRDGNPSYPPDGGFASAPQPLVLPIGTLIDRFGDDCGSYFSPKGVRFSMRALPTVCENPDYSYKVYRVTLPLLVWAGKARPWFEEPGEGMQFKTDSPAFQLLADHIIEPVADSSPKPCADR